MLFPKMVVFWDVCMMRVMAFIIETKSVNDIAPSILNMQRPIVTWRTFKNIMWFGDYISDKNYIRQVLWDKSKIENLYSTKVQALVRLFQGKSETKFIKLCEAFQWAMMVEESTMKLSILGNCCMKTGSKMPSFFFFFFFFFFNYTKTRAHSICSTGKIPPSGFHFI